MGQIQELLFFCWSAVTKVLGGMFITKYSQVQPQGNQQSPFELRRFNQPSSVITMNASCQHQTSDVIRLLRLNIQYLLHGRISNQSIYLQ
jgi:hypothetical protein